MPAVVNELKIDYDTTAQGGGLTTIGGSTDYLIVGPWKLDIGVTNGDSFRKAVIECTIFISATTEAAFVAARQAIEAAFSRWGGKVVVTLGATAQLTIDPVAHTGFNATPRLRDLGSELDTGRSRSYELRIECDLVSNLPNFLADLAVEFWTSPAGLRNYKFKGTYTSTTGGAPKTASQQYLAAIGPYANTYFATLPVSPLTGNAGKFQVAVPDKAEADYNDNVCHFERTYTEIIANESVGVLDDPDLVQTTLEIERSDSAPGDAPLDELTKRYPGMTLPQLVGQSVLRPTELIVSYEAFVVGTTDLLGKWNAKVKPWLLNVLTSYSSGQLAVEPIAPRFDLVTNRILATVRAHAINSTLLSLEITIDDDQDYGVVIDETHGDPLDAEVDQMAARYTRVITRVSETTGPVQLFDEAGLTIPRPNSQGWVSLKRARKKRRRQRGLESVGKTVKFVEVTDVELLRFVKRGSSGGGPNRTPTFSGLGAPSTSSPPTTTSGSSGPTPGAPSPTGGG